MMNIGKQGNRLLSQCLRQEILEMGYCSGTGKDITSEPPKLTRRQEFEKKLRAKTPLGKLDEHDRHPFQEKEPLQPWPNSLNPNTGEVGGPAGPEPTRYGDWERKGRVSDF